MPDITTLSRYIVRSGLLGEVRWVNLRTVPVHSIGTPAAFLGTVEDVTDRRRFEELLAWQATHDPLTRLPNRAQLQIEITSAIESGGLSAEQDMAVLFFDLDDFKQVNDTMGHRAGDELLVEVAQRLRTAVRDHDHVFRYAGDEFVVLAHGASDDVEALGVAERLRLAVARPMALQDGDVEVHCSVGVVRATNATTADELIRDADVAMYQAKRNGKGSSAVFDLLVRDERDRELRFVERASFAIESRALSVEYHPVVQLDSRRTIGVEALLRWHDDEFGDVAATSLVDVAERCNLVGELTRFVIEQTCADFEAWRSAEAAPEWVSVNLSHSQLESEGFIDHLARTLLSHRLTGEQLAIDLAESDWIRAEDMVHGIIGQLVDLGTRLVIDDVGASLSSLLSLTRPTISAIKLDPSLLFDEHERTVHVIRAVIGLARDLQIDVIAEGVETEDHLARIACFDLDLAQGYTFGYPVIAAGVPSLVNRPSHDEEADPR